MKKAGILLSFLVGMNFVSAQEKPVSETQADLSIVNKITYNPYRKGAIFLYWGWNRAIYSNSDVHFRGNGYDFTLHNMIAKDRPTDFSFDDYLNPLRVTIPQTNARIGYFIKDNLALVLALDHMKYVMKQD